MSVFTPAEIAYLGTQRLGRIATVGPSGQPHAVPVWVADVLDSGGDASRRGYDPQIFRVRPRQIISWGFEGDRRSVRIRP